MRNVVLASIAIILCWKFLPSYSNRIDYDNYQHRDSVKKLLWQPPLQEELNESTPLHLHDYKLTSLARFSANAVILHKKSYFFGRESDLSPIDLAVGWGAMSERSVLRQLDISQANRWFYWKTAELPIPRREIETQSANIHIIPADDWVETQVDELNAGDAVRLQGDLVRVDADDGWRWRSSLSRNDSGNGACEVLLLKRLHVLN